MQNQQTSIKRNQISYFNPVSTGYTTHDTNMIIDAKKRLREELKEPYCSKCVFVNSSLEHNYPNTLRLMEKILNEKISEKDLFTTRDHLQTHPTESQIISIEKTNLAQYGPLTKIHCKSYIEKDLFNF
ncbi:MAG: hypothetical protein PF569_10210 [Candidatus Woesearchaeota archaeon]|jgi:hypothetical protein|nr:hypothetical protein [Candidatus Woesearchaeota archaeon]